MNTEQGIPNDEVTARLKIHYSKFEIRYFLTTVFAFLFFFVSSFAQKTQAVSADTLAKNGNQCLKFNCRIKEDDKALDSTAITVYDNQEKLLTVLYPNQKGNCDFRLPFNRKFIIEISKKGYVAKRFEVNTLIPPEKKIVYIFPIEVVLLKSVEGKNYNDFKKIIAKIIYCKDLEQFDFDNGDGGCIGGSGCRIVMPMDSIKLMEELLRKEKK